MFGVGNPLTEIFGMLNGQHGMFPNQQQPQQPPATTAAPPASFRARAAIPIIKITADDLVEQANQECLICLQEQVLGGTAAKLPCGHIYHEECVKEWLKRHCTCPFCRYELETEDPEFERGRKERMKGRKMIRCRREELDHMSVRDLKNLMIKCSVSFAGCVDKCDLVSRLLASGCVELVTGAPPQELEVGAFEALSVAQLKHMLLQFGLEMPAGMVEKGEIRQLLLNSGRVVLKEAEVQGTREGGGAAADQQGECGARQGDGQSSATSTDGGPMEMEPPDSAAGGGSGGGDTAGSSSSSDVNNSGSSSSSSGGGEAARAGASEDADYVHVRLCTPTPTVAASASASATVTDAGTSSSSSYSYSAHNSPERHSSFSAGYSTASTPKNGAGAGGSSSSASSGGSTSSSSSASASASASTSSTPASTRASALIQLPLSLLQELSVRELKEMMSGYKISTVGCFEKSDLIRQIEVSGKLEVVRSE